MKIYTLSNRLISATGYTYPFDNAYILVRFLNGIGKLSMRGEEIVPLEEIKYQNDDYQLDYYAATLILNDLMLNQGASKPVSVQYAKYLLDDEDAEDIINGMKEEGRTFGGIYYIFDDSDPIYRNNHYLDENYRITQKSTIIRLKEFYEYVFLLVDDYYISKNKNYAFRIDLSEHGEIIEYSYKNITGYSEVNSVEELVLLSLKKMVGSEATIKRCEYCGDFFIPNVRNTEIYCLKIHENGRSCKDMGPDKKVESDVALDLYRRMYKRYNQKWNKPNSQEGQKKWKKWVREAKLKREKYKDREISSEEFVEWLNIRRD